MKKEVIGEFLAERRKSLGVRQKELAALCGISEHALVNLERGNGNPTLAVLDSVLDVLGLEIDIKAKDAELR